MLKIFATLVVNLLLILKFYITILLLEKSVIKSSGLGGANSDIKLIIDNNSTDDTIFLFSGRTGDTIVTGLEYLSIKISEYQA